MTRSRRIAFVSAIVVGVGLAGALGALYLDPARAAVGPLPGEGLVLPADARFVMGLDVQRFVASPFYQRFGKQKGLGRPEALSQIEQQTGLNPERDVDRIVAAGGAGGPHDAGVALVNGRFDQYKLARAIEQRKGVTSKKHEGVVEYLFSEGSRGAHAFAFLDDDTIAIGSQAAVEATIASKVKGQSPLKANAQLIGLLERVKPGATFWLVGDQSLLSRMPQTLPAPGGGANMALPALKSLVVTGDLDPVLSFQATGETGDEAAARSLADVVRGLVALAQLQAAQKPELKELASAVSVATEGNRVHLNARLPYTLLDSLQPKQAPAPLPVGE